MSEQFSHYAYMDGPPDFSTSFAGTDVKHGYHESGRNNDFRVQSVVDDENSASFSQTCGSAIRLSHHNMSTNTFSGFPGWVPPLNGTSFPSTWVADAIPNGQVHNLIQCDMDDSSRAHSLTPADDRYRRIGHMSSDEVAMTTFDDHAHYSHTDAHGYYYGAFHDFAQDNVAGYSQSLPSHPIAMSIVPRSLSVDRSYHQDSLSSADPTFHIHPPFPPTEFCPPPPSHPPIRPIWDLSPDRVSSSVSIPPPSNRNSPNIMPSETWAQSAIQLHPSTSTPLDRSLVVTVPLSMVEFPSAFRAQDMPFFRCHWDGCGVWITSEKEAVKRHLTCCHDVLLKGNSVAAKTPCKWDDCSSSLQRDNLVRHVHIHLSLQWLCSECKGAYTRSDSVKSHTRREDRCQFASPISCPSALAYKAKINPDDTVTLTKMLQP